MEWIIIVVAGLVWFTFVTLFTPRIDYRVTNPLRPDSDEFVHVVQTTCQAIVHGHNRVEIFTNGAQFYPAMRDAILSAEGSVNIEAYIFEPGEAAGMLVDAMVARARAGVRGSPGARCHWQRRRWAVHSARRLREAGCEVRFYQPAHAGTACTA